MDVRTGEPYPAYKESGVEWLSAKAPRWEVELKAITWLGSRAARLFRFITKVMRNAEIPFSRSPIMNIPRQRKSIFEFAPNTVSM